MENHTLLQVRLSIEPRNHQIVSARLWAGGLLGTCLNPVFKMRDRQTKCRTTLAINRFQTSTHS